MLICVCLSVVYGIVNIVGFVEYISSVLGL